MERVLAALLLAALLFATRVNNSSADKPFQGRRLSVHIDPMLLKYTRVLCIELKG